MRKTYLLSVLFTAAHFFSFAQSNTQNFSFSLGPAKTELLDNLGIISSIRSKKSRGFNLDTTTGKLKEFTPHTLLNLTRENHPDILKAFKASKRNLKNLEAALVKLNLTYP